MKKSEKGKKIIYGILAAILIIAGLYIESRPDGEEAGNETEVIENTIAENVTEGSETESSEPAQSEADTEVQQTESDTEPEAAQPEDFVEYYFRNEDLLEQHYEKHGMEMGFDSMEEYEEAACAVVNNPDALTKTEAEDGDYVYYVEETNEFVVVSKDGYIRTYFYPSAGIDYYNRQ